MLAAGYLVVAHLNLHAHGFQRQDDLAAHLLRLVTGREVEIAADIVRRGAGGKSTVVRAVALEQEELQFGADVVDVPPLGGPGQRARQYHPWRAERGLSVRAVGVADQARAPPLLRAPREYLVGSRVGHQYHVALEDPCKPLDRRAIEPDSLLEGRLKPADGDRDALDRAQDVGELQADEAYPILLRTGDQIVRHIASCIALVARRSKS